jgi:hypothetical protein
MPINTRPLAIAFAVMLAVCGASGCSTINSSLTGAGEMIPQWMGGMPPDVPPRRGSPKYDEYMQEQERKRLTPAPPKEDPAQAQSPSAGLAPVH